MSRAGIEALQAALRSPDGETPLSELVRLSELKPESVETVTSTGNPEDGTVLWYQAMNHAETLLARYAEIMDEVQAANDAKPFDAFAADARLKKYWALLAEMREEGKRIRAERGRAGR